MQQVQKKPLDREGLRIVPPLVRFLNSEGPAQADVQSREPLLSVQNRGNRSVGYFPEGRAMGIVALVVLAREVEELKRLGGLPLDLPEQEGPDRKALHQAIE